MTEREVRLHEEAQKEYELAVEWYEHRQRGLGGSLVEAVQRAIGDLRDGRATLLLSSSVPVGHDIRRVQIARFPYHLFVAERSFGYWVLAVAHHRRRPGYWLPRVVT